MTTTPDYRKLFPILENSLYLNHAAIGPWPAVASQSVCAFANENAIQGPNDYAHWVRRERELRQYLREWIKAGGDDDIALLKNTTEGISAVAWGLPWQSGDHMVLPADEFPSNHLPWLAQQKLGVQVQTVDIRAHQDAEAALISALTPRTKVLSVSAVQWTDGFKLDLERLGRACRKRGVWFFVDAIQQIGALPIDVEACCIDALAADAHKWMLGPEGIAVFYCNERLREQCTLLQQGWHMFEDPWNFDRTDWTASSCAKRFEAGSPNTLGQVALHATLELVRTIGEDRIALNVLRNTDQLIEELNQRAGFTLRSRTESTRKSGIVSFQCRSMRPSQLAAKLRAEGVACAKRNDAVRLSPHFYQGESEINQFFEVLDRLVA